MFTGIITHQGSIEATESRGDLRIFVRCDFTSAKIGESIAVNGACLTVVEISSTTNHQPPTAILAFDVSAETIACTAPRWHKGARVNLERAAKLGDSLDGHLVTGHVDGTATLKDVAKDGDSHILCFEAPQNLSRLIAAKGSVTLDGVSLTVNKVDGATFRVNIIPHSWQNTTLGNLKINGAVNIEVDLIARYVERLMNASGKLSV